MPLDLTPAKMPYYTIVDTLPPSIDDTIQSIYRAVLTQSGTNNPTVQEDANNTLTGITWTRGVAGTYLAQKTDAFTENKTYITAAPHGEGNLGFIHTNRVDDDNIVVNTFDNTQAAADGILQLWSIQITITN